MKRKSLIVLITLLAVGFAAVTTTLVINGTSLFGTNDDDDFDVIFTKAIIDGVNKSSLVISEDGKSITYETKELAIINDESILEFTVKNTSTQYDAEVSIECIGGVSEGTYYKIEKKLVDYVPAQASEDGSVLVTMLKSSTEPIEEEFICTITASAIERNTLADISHDTEVTWRDEDNDYQISLGDIVSLSKEDVSTEEFYVLSVNEESIEMMSMYNLYVGGESSNVTGSWINTPYENPTGIQDSRMIGWTSTTDTIRRGTIAFSSDAKKRENYSDYSGSIVEEHVNNYSNYLKNILEIENTATLVSKNELESYGCSTIDVTCIGAPEFLYGTSYWTRSAYDDDIVWYVSLAGHFYNVTPATYATRSGVRPVITIDTDLIEVPTKICNDVGDVCWIDLDYSETKTIGDVITLGTEENSIEKFYILNANEENIEMMAKYNLYVGSECLEASTSSCVAYENPTGIQDSEMIGIVSEETIRRGVTAFSQTSVEYAGSIVEGYVKDYSSYLSNTLGVENTATIISKEELDIVVGRTLNLGDFFNDANVPAFLYSSTYWTRSAYNETNVIGVVFGGYVGNFKYYYPDSYGVRPVVTISADLITN